MASMLYLLLHAVAFVALTTALVLPGSLLGHRFEEVGTLRPTAELLIGLTFWTAWTLILATLGLLWPVLLAAPVPLFAAGWWILRRRSSDRARKEPPGLSPGTWLAGAGLAGLLLPLALLAASPTVSWDASAYHLTLPRLYLEHGGFRPVEFNVYSNWPLGTEMLFLLALALLGPGLAKLLHFGFGLLVLWTLALGLRELDPGEATPGRTARGWLAAAFFLANGVVLFEMRVAYVDLALAFYFLAAFLFLLRYQRDPTTGRSALFAAGLACGLLASTKVSGIAAVAILAVLLLGSLRKSPRDLAFYFALPTLLLWLPWPARSTFLTGNPFYPLLYGWFGGPDWNLRLSEQLTTWQQGIGMGREPLDYLLLPLRVILLGDRGYDNFDGHLSVAWLLLLPLALLFHRRPGIKPALMVSGLYFVYWSLTAQQMRFLVPILPLLSMAAAIAAGALLDRLESARDRRVGAALAVAAALFFVAFSQSSVFAAGYRSLGRYLVEEPPLGGQPPEIFQRMDELPPDARVLFLSTNQGYFSPREYLADSFFEASQITAWLADAPLETMGDRLAERDITHVLVDRQPRGAEYPQALWRHLTNPRHASPLFESGNYVLLALETPE